MDSDLISRDALIRDMYEDGYFPLTVADKATEKIMAQPTVDAVKVVHGEWLSAHEYALKIGVTDEEKLEEAKKDKWWKFCNNCEQQVRGVRNYCPNCGADMRGKENASD